MSIRIKLLLLLVGFALGTLLVVAFIDLRSARALGTDLGERTRDLLATQAEAELEQIVLLSSQVLERDRRVIGLMLESQQRDARRALLGPPPTHTLPVYTYTDYDELDARLDRDPEALASIPGYETNERFRRIDAEGVPRPIRVTLAHPVFKLAPGVDPASVAGEVRRLASLGETYRELRAGYGRDAYWQYIGTASGVMCSYPGRGGYPPEYDPRTRNWFSEAAQAGGAIWSRPIIDATTNQLTVTRAAPIYDDAGALVAVTAVDVVLTDALARIELPERLAQGSITMLVARLENGADPVVLAERASLLQPTSEFEPGDWAVLPHVVPLPERAQASLGVLEERLAEGGAGVVRQPYRGQDSFWAFGPAGAEGRTSLVVVVPVARLVAPAEAAEQIAIQRTHTRQLYTLVALLAVGVVVVLVAMRASRSVIRPVLTLQTAAERVAEGDLDARAEVKTGDEIERLAGAFNEMIPKLRDQMHVRESLALAMEVQQRLLPDEPPALSGWSIAGISDYCDETGGDYYDFIPVRAEGETRDRLAIVVGDVTGHGIAAALLMATARAMLRTRLAAGGAFGELFADINTELTRDSDAGRFMTLCFLVLDAGTRRVAWVSAGHDPAMLYHPAERRWEDLGGGDIPLGIEGGWTFSEHRRAEPVPEGAVLVVGTDGIWEAADHTGEQFGKDRMKDSIARALDANAHATPDEIASAVIADLTAFRGEVPQADDVTLVVVRAT